MRSQGEGAADQAVQGDFVTHGGLQFLHSLQHDGDTAGVLLGDAAAAGNALIFIALQGMGGDRRRVVLGPHQLAAQDLSLQLQVKHNGHAVGAIQAGDFHQGLIQLLAVLQDLFCSVALQLTGMNTGEGHPGSTLGGLMAQRLEQ